MPLDQLTSLKGIEARVERGERLSPEDGVRLLTSHDLLTLGRMADLVRRRKNGDQAYFVVNTHLNYTNVCWVDCKFCAFQRKVGQEGAYTMSLEEIRAWARTQAGKGFREVHIVGGVHPTLPFEYYEDMMRIIRAEVPEAHIQAFTAVEIDYICKRGKLTLEQGLRRLQAAGLGSLPGGGSEVFSQRVHDLAYPHKMTAERWLELHETAHRLGIRSNASILYGHIETPEEIIDHLCRLRDLQDRTGGFQTFLAFGFYPENTQLEKEFGIREATSGIDDLKMMAVARLMLDNFDHVKAFWMIMGSKLAQVSLHFGVDDLDGTVMEERIVHDAGAQVPQLQPKEAFIRAIRQAGRVPVERDTVFNVVRTY